MRNYELIKVSISKVNIKDGGAHKRKKFQRCHKERKALKYTYGTFWNQDL